MCPDTEPPNIHHQALMGLHECGPGAVGLEYPPRQKAASFSIKQVLDKMNGSGQD